MPPTNPPGERAEQQQRARGAGVVEPDLAQRDEGDEHARGDHEAVLLQPRRGGQRLGEPEHARRLVGGRQRADVAPQARRDEPQQRQHGDDRASTARTARRRAPATSAMARPMRARAASRRGSPARPRPAGGWGSACSSGTRSWRSPGPAGQPAGRRARRRAASPRPRSTRIGAAEPRVARGERLVGVPAHARQLAVRPRASSVTARGRPSRNAATPSAAGRDDLGAAALGLEARRRAAGRTRGRARPRAARRRPGGSAASRSRPRTASHSCLGRVGQEAGSGRGLRRRRRQRRVVEEAARVHGLGPGSRRDGVVAEVGHPDGALAARRCRSGCCPTAIGAPPTRLVAGSMRVTVFEPLLTTHTKPVRGDDVLRLAADLDRLRRP